MSTTDQSTARTMRTRPMRTRTLRDDLLDDLRWAAPMPAAQAEVRPAGPSPARTEAPTVGIAVTPRLWWGVRMATLGEGPGVVIGAGPVRISLTGFRR